MALTTLLVSQSETSSSSSKLPGDVSALLLKNVRAFSYVTEHGGSPNDATGNTAGAMLVANIKDTKSMVQALNLDKDIPIGNSDAGSYFNDLVLEAVEYGVSIPSRNRDS